MRRVPACVLLISSMLLLVASPRADPGLDAAVQQETDRLAERGLDLMRQREIRLLRVSDAVRLHGAPLCGGELSPILGALAWNRNNIPEAYRPVARRLYGIDRDAYVVHVLPGYPADRAGLRAGDFVSHIEGRRVHAAETVSRIHRKRVSGSISLRVLRDGKTLELEVDVVEGCFHPAYLTFGDWVNAVATGSEMVFSTGMMRFASSDDELAAVVGHELAHNILDNEVRGGKWQEADADYFGAYLAARAGYDPAAAVDVWKRMGLEYVFTSDPRFAYSHPTSPRRALALQRTLQEIERKRVDGEPLEPEWTD